MLKIMVAAMDVLVSTQLEERLISMGYEVVGKAYSGESAVEKARLLRPDLILMGIVMPGKLDSINTAETIKAELAIPVIFLNTSGDDMLDERAKNVESFGYLPRSLQESEIKAAIEVALCRKDLEQRLRESEEQLEREIAERKRAEEQAKASLREKEVLLEEIHHRVKNNLQLISGLLDMSSMRTHSQDVIDLIKDARAKIHIMALIHNQLYRSERFDQIDLGSHVREMVSYLSQVYANRKKLITPVIEHSDVYLSVTQAIPCALALNEVISNAFKHAFIEGQKGTIEISIQSLADDTIFIRVKDDGIGIPEGIDIYKADSLGLKLIRNLVQEQLKGKIQIDRNNGTDVSIEFKISKEKVK